MIQHNTFLVAADKSLPLPIAAKLLPLLQDHCFREFFSFIVAYTDSHPAIRTLILTGEYKDNTQPGTLYIPTYTLQSGVLQLSLFLLAQTGQNTGKILKDFMIAPASFPHPYPVYYEAPPESLVLGLLWSLSNPVKLHLMQLVRTCNQVTAAPTIQSVRVCKMPQKITLP